MAPHDEMSGAGAELDSGLGHDTALAGVTVPLQIQNPKPQTQNSKPRVGAACRLEGRNGAVGLSDASLSTVF